MSEHKRSSLKEKIAGVSEKIFFVENVQISETSLWQFAANSS